MNVDWLIPCRYVEVHDNLGTIVGAGIDTYWLPQLPTGLQVLIAVRLQGLPEELTPDTEHSITQIIAGPEGDVIAKVEGKPASSLGRRSWSALTGFKG